MERQINSLNTTQLVEQINRLKTLCDEVDPYQDLDEKTQKELKYFNIEMSDDPYKLTNHLIFLLENMIEELHSRKDFDEQALH